MVGVPSGRIRFGTNHRVKTLGSSTEWHGRPARPTLSTTGSGWLDRKTSAYLAPLGAERLFLFCDFRLADSLPPAKSSFARSGQRCAPGPQVSETLKLCAPNSFVDR
jgi:hypothetical protein